MVPGRDMLDNTLDRDLATLLNQPLDRTGKGTSYYDMKPLKPGFYILVKKTVRPSVLDFLLKTYYGAEVLQEEKNNATHYIVSENCYVIYTPMEGDVLAEEIENKQYAEVVKVLSAAKELNTANE